MVMVILWRSQCHRDWVCVIEPSTVAVLLTNKIEAQRFKQQFFVSIDILHSHSSMGQETFVALALEKQVVKTLKELQQ